MGILSLCCLYFAALPIHIDFRVCLNGVSGFNVQHVSFRSGQRLAPFRFFFLLLAFTLLYFTINLTLTPIKPYHGVDTSRLAGL